MTRTTNLQDENMTLITTVNVLAAFRTAAAASAAANVKVKRIEISQSGSTTLEMIRGEIATRNTAGTFTTAATTPIELHPIDGAVSGLSGNVAPVGAAGRSGTLGSVDSGGTYVTLIPFAFANLNGYLWKPAPDEELWVPVDTVLVVRFLADPTTLTGWTVSVILDED